MIVSFSKSFLFVHVPKTAGTSMRAVLSKYQHANDHFWSNRLLGAMGIPINYCLGNYLHYRFRTHEPILRAVQVYPPNVLEGLFKFALVRNPWDLLVSYRNFLCASPGHKRHRRVARMGFDEFLRFAIQRRIGCQKSLLSDQHGRIIVDFVGRFENLAHDYLLIAQRLWISERLPHVNRGPRRDYREAYTWRTRQLVQDAYAEDIDEFGYEFDGFDAAVHRQAA
jgi:hypothetical protein